jgi:hypothetical protein
MVSRGSEAFNLVPSHHQYSIGHITLFVSLVLSAAASFRCASRAIETVIPSLELSLSSPSWFSGRLWLFRRGYFKLMRPKERAGDWVWIVDHTVQLGVEKCLVILGIRLCNLPAPGDCLSQEDVEPLALFPVKQSSGEVVFQQLDDTIPKTEVPREIIGDRGTDLKSGIEKFCQEHPETCYVYDIKHKTAAVLKHELQKDEAWHEFSKLAAQTRKKIQQTSLAALAPPNQRTKARYMNVDSLIQWGENMLTFFDQQQTNASSEFDPEQLEKKLGWITRFREQLEVWKELIQIITTTEGFVRTQGLYHDSYLELRELLALFAHTERTKKACAQLLAFVAEESLKAKPNERLLGSSEVIESIFGKLKRMEQDQAKNGFTGLLLSISAMISTTTGEVVQKAMETVPTEKVLAWCKENIGQSVQAKRREAFVSHDKPKQK